MMANWWQHGQKQKLQLSLMDQIMKNMFFLFTALLGMTFSTAITAEEGVYAGILGGANWLNQSSRHHVKVDYKAGYLVGANLGYTWCNNWSLEGEFTYRHNQNDKVKFHHHNVGCKKHSSSSSDNKHHNHGNLRSYAIMANVRYDIAIDCCFTPYIRAGIGYANSKFEHKNKDNGSKVAGSDCGKHSRHHSENGFAYQAGVGFSMPIGCNTALDIGYNFLRAEKELNNQSVVVAARYTF
jgi:opacity protein-like surface antigen